VSQETFFWPFLMDFPRDRPDALLSLVPTEEEGNGVELVPVPPKALVAGETLSALSSGSWQDMKRKACQPGNSQEISVERKYVGSMLHRNGRDQRINRS